jgi:hypothetical protein
MYHPAKYYEGLSLAEKAKRKLEIEKFGAKKTGDPSAYVGFETDKGVPTRKSNYSKAWAKLFPDAKSLPARAKSSGVPLKFIRRCYNRGLAAWRTGHRPGATQQQWGYARVASFLLCGKTHYTADADLVEKAKAESTSAKKWFARCPK